MDNQVKKTEEEQITEKRVAFIAKVLDMTTERAFILNKFIADIPYKEISSFFKYRVGFHEEHASKEMVTLKAYKSYIRRKTVKQIEKGEFVFRDFDEMLEFIQVFFAGEDLTKGAHGFKDHVIIRVSNSKRLLDSSELNESGFARQLDMESEISVYEWLFLNQGKIGYAPIMSDDRKKKLEALLAKKLAEKSGLTPKDTKKEEFAILESGKNPKLQTKPKEEGGLEELPPIDMSAVSDVFGEQEIKNPQ